MSQPRLTRSFTLVLALATLAPLGALAQSNAPLTGNMSGGAAAGAAQSAPLPAATLPNRPVVQQVQTSMPQADAPAATQAAAPAAAQPAAEVREGFGDVTRGLLAAQADGRRAGGVLPILGPVSSAAWTRYVDSFKRPIPEWFQERVEIKNTN